MKDFPSLSLSSPLPSFPVEIHQAILQRCDQPTLAVASRVSFAFLEMSSPLLYDDIDIEYGGQVAQLFCKRDPSTDQPQLRPYLSLDAVRILTICGIDRPAARLPVTTDRVVNELVKVKQLNLHPVGNNANAHYRDDNLWGHFLKVLAPEEVRLLGRSTANHPYPATFNVDRPVMYNWVHTLRRVVLKNVDMVRSIADSADIWPVVEEGGHPLEIVLDFTDHDVGEPVGGWSDFPMWDQLSIAALEEWQDGGRVKDFQVQVRSEAAREAFIYGWAQAWVTARRDHPDPYDHDGADVVEDEPWSRAEMEAGRIRLEIADKEERLCFDG